METNVRAKVTHGGRIVIPVEMRRHLGIEIGEDVNLSLVDDSLSISTSKNALQRLRQSVRSGKQTNGSVVDELIADRRRESENE